MMKNEHIEDALNLLGALAVAGALCWIFGSISPLLIASEALTEFKDVL